MHRYILIGLAVLSSGVWAENRDATVRVTFENIDRNSDDRISRTEAATHKSLIDRFAAVDTNADGFISKAELEAGQK